MRSVTSTFNIYITLLAGLLLSAGLDAATPASGPIEMVRGEVVWENPHGFTPIHITVRSYAPVELDLELRHQGTSATKRVLATPGMSSHRVLMPPMAGEDFWRDTKLFWRTVNQQGEERIGREHDDIAVPIYLIDPEQSVDQPELERAVTGSSISSSATSDVIRRDPGQLPDRWQGYPLASLVMITPAAIAELSQEQLRAVQLFAEATGRLLLTGAAPRGSGLGIARIVSPGQYDAVVSSYSKDLLDHDPERVVVPGTEGAAQGWFSATAIIFALVVGPFNFLWVMRRRQRSLLLWTVPLISGTTCCGLLAINLIADGVTTKRHTDQMVWLDGGHHRQVAYTAISYFSPFGTNNQALPTESQIVSLDESDFDFAHTYYHNYQNSVTKGLQIEWAAQPMMSGPWVPPRVTRRWMFMEPSTTRQRLQLRAADSGYVLVNTLNVGIKQFEYTDQAGQTWSSDGPVAIGAIANLQPLDGRSQVQRSFRKQHDHWAPVVKERWDAAKQTGHFQAELQRALQADVGFPGEEMGQGLAFVCGPLVVAEAGSAEPSTAHNPPAVSPEGQP